MRELVYVGVIAAMGVAVWSSDRAGERTSGGDAAALTPDGGALAAAPVRYGRDIRPLLSDRCFKCHGPDPSTRAAELRLDVREIATAEREGVRAIVPGDLGSSDLWRRINSTDPDEHMPPPDSHKRSLSESEIALVGAWIEQGAAYESHWAFEPPKRAELPGSGGDAREMNPIDRFVLDSLSRHGLTMSPEADRGTLLRRVFLDVTGLPPTPDEIAGFYADTAPDAYERWVDKLLTEEPYRTRYAERMTAPWLDQARYADTSGIHMDAGRSAWPWRDWVLRAYHENMPFDRFVTEQLAGDLLPGATRDQKVASGFNRQHVTTDEGGAIAEEYLVEYAVDRVSTTGSVFLGLTLGCARCHDHKFDPVTMTDFYSLISFFNSIEEPGLYSQVPDAKRALEPFLDVPSAEQDAKRAQIRGALTSAEEQRTRVTPQEQRQFEEFLANTASRAGVAWAATGVTAASSADGSTLTVQPDRSVLVSGKNPDTDRHTITLRTQGTDLRLVLLEALADPSLPMGRVGRAPNGNAVLSAISAEAVSVANPEQRRPVRLVWAWASHEQGDGDYRVVNALDAGDPLGWAVDAHRVDGNRIAMFLAEEPFGYDGGTDVRVTLEYITPYTQHTLGRVRLSLGTINDAGLAMLPETAGSWRQTGPFRTADYKEVFEKSFGPEQDPAIDLGKNFGSAEAPMRWSFAPDVADAKLVNFGDGRYAQYIARRVYSPTERTQTLSLGSDDGIRVFVNGVDAFSKQVDRSLAPDQDLATITLKPGLNSVVFKIVNTGGVCGFFHRIAEQSESLRGPLASALAPPEARWAELEAQTKESWLLNASPQKKELAEKVKALNADLAALESAIPRTMVMKELDKPRETFVLDRGQYDHPNKSRPVGRAVPASLGSLADDAPKDRVGLARWLTSPENPLLARVTVNRSWEMLFGTGIVRTTEDFGYQGEWPSHPELLDWLAVEFRESGWDVRHMLRLMLTSRAYRQASRVNPAADAVDPENRLLSSFPRRRLSAEQVRDQALYVSGLLVEKFGGASVKPYQPPGLWEEVAMVQSNTRVFERGNGEDLYRRSLYTYWKRASPPPNLMTFDAPTRESCTIRRSSTNTPLQALVLWNDEQFVEASRVLAARVIRESAADSDRLARLVVSCTGRVPSAGELGRLTDALAAFRARYRGAPADAEALLKVGTAPRPEGVDPAELAAWTMIANAVLNLDASVSKG